MTEPAGVQGADQGKAIILFSDGTGNSSAKLFKTNVWRMYEAVDLGPPAGGKRPQISYYDDGVGTSSFKPWALLGGAFGWGLKRNVLDIYRYACRNYRPGDDIYGFGFSRGAFTMRVAIALIAAEGLVRSDGERDLVRRSARAYRRFRQDFMPRKVHWPTTAGRWLRDSLIEWWDRRKKLAPYDASENRHPTIRFVGVWDTVAAYGGPIVEITRAIDNWVYPLSMPDYELHPKVQCARHALALDDERDSFQPLLWDEVHEQELIHTNKVSPDRLQQVWFTGMHSDVGGGYPDESLSYVSLLWMMEEAEKANLRTLTNIKDRYIALASSAGPIHDSRRGAAAYYRYQPRKIAAWLDPVDPRTYSLRDPTIKGHDRRPKGLLHEVHIHESVIARIAMGTDRYAPITLPETFTVIPPQLEGENVPQPSSDDAKTPQKAAAPRSMIGRALRDRLKEVDTMAVRAKALEGVWDFGWRRRVAYFVTILLAVILLLMPVWVSLVPAPAVLSDGRTWLGNVIRLATWFLPGFLNFWIDTYANNSVYFLALSVVVGLVMAYSSRCELTLRDRARRIWHEATTIGGPAGEEPAPTGLERFRNAPKYQRGVQIFKWTVLPNMVVAPLMALVGLWVIAGVGVQTRLPWLESGTSLCAPTGGSLPELTRRQVDFSTRSTCVPIGASVVKGTTYLVTFDVVDPWRDGQTAASPSGVAAADLGWGRGYLGAIFRRIIDAGYLQPAIEIRPLPRAFALDNVYIYPLSPVQDGHGSVYQAEFKAQRSGELLMFANDAVNPFDVRAFYENSGLSGGDDGGNRGTACVTIRRADLPAEDLDRFSTSACGNSAGAGPFRTHGSHL